MKLLIRLSSYNSKVMMITYSKKATIYKVNQIINRVINKVVNRIIK